jgi:hypothetical protein
MGSREKRWTGDLLLGDCRQPVRPARTIRGLINETEGGEDFWKGRHLYSYLFGFRTAPATALLGHPTKPIMYGSLLLMGGYVHV